MDSSLSAPLAVAGWIAVAILGGYVFYKVLSGAFWAIGRCFAGIGWFFRHLATFIGAMLRDALHLVGGLVTSACYACSIAINTVFGRAERAAHYGRALEAELSALIPRCYRLAVGHVARLLLLTPITEGVEKRLPEVVASEPPVRPSLSRVAPFRAGDSGAFDGYRVIGELQPGGSGARLFLAEPDEARRRQLAAAGRPAPSQVVIKSFSLHDGSTLPQIVRENRALVAARDLGLVLEHELTSSRFHYVMPYVPGEDLATVTARLHAGNAGTAASANSAGLDAAGLRLAVGYATDLAATLDRFHRAGLWHKDVKPGNIIVSEGRVHLVDLGLITPLRSAMTLTTHGTEYFRDPEMVRLALKGVKVHEVDGAKFDIYGAGAVLFSLIENGFPAHGSLSRLTRRCPEALALIVRRAMADMAHRYGSAQELLADLQCVAAAPDPFALRPADLPSFSRDPVAAASLAAEATPAAAASPSIGGASIGNATIGSAAAARAPAATLATDDDETRGFFGRRRARREQRTQRRLERRGGNRWLLFVCILAGLYFSGVIRHGDGRLGRSLDSSVLVTSPFSYELDTLPASSAAAPGARVAASSSGPALSHADFQILESVSLDRLPQSAVPPAPAAPLGTILVIDDLPANTTPERRAAVDQLCEQLRKSPYALIGATDATSAEAGHDETEISLLAGARAAVGLSDPSDAEAVARLTAYLADQAPTLDAILWFGHGEAAEPIHIRAIARNQTIAQALSKLLGR